MIPRPLSTRGALWGLGFALLLAGAARGQAPADSVLRDFEPNGDYVLLLGGEKQKADIYLSQRASAYLIVSPAFESPLMISPRSRNVEAVDVMSLAKRSSGSVDILANATLATVSPFRLDGGEIVFEVAGRQARLAPKPPLLGLQAASGLAAYSPNYSRGADGYTPDAAAVAALRKQAQSVQVRVFFGTWCDFCKRYVPYVLKVEEALAGSKVRFDYYGLPEPPEMAQDPEAKKLGVSSVPTGIVYVGGREAGRLSGRDWSRPEVSLQRLLN